MPRFAKENKSYGNASRRTLKSSRSGFLVTHPRKRRIVPAGRLGREARPTSTSRGGATPAERGSPSRQKSGSSRFYVKDLVLQGFAARRQHLDGLALLLAQDGLADRGLVRELVLGRIRLRGADDVVLDRLLRGHVAQLHVRTD